MRIRQQRIIVLVALLLALGVVACTGVVETGERQQLKIESTGEAVNLDGTQWTLSVLNGKSLIDGSRITLNFADGYVNGFAGCNGYRSLIIGTDTEKYKYRATDDGLLTIPNFVITEKDCSTPEGVMQQEMAYVETLRNAAAFRLKDDSLEIEDASGETRLVFNNAKTEAMRPSELEGSAWILTSLNGERLLEGTHITLNFTAGMANGFAGCNAYGSPYRETGTGSLTIIEVAVTAQGCLEPEGVLQQEDAYIAALADVKAYSVKEERLEIENAAGELTLVFAREREFSMEPSELLDTAWRLVSWDGDSPIEGSNITLFFRDGNEVAGHAGCRGYVASYEASGDGIRFPFLGMVGPFEHCSEPLMLQEGEYTTSLGWTNNYRLADGQLELLTARGEVLLFEPLSKEADVSLEGTAWTLAAFGEERMAEEMSLPLRMITDLIAGTEITATFEQGTAQGSAGCNTYGAAYTIEGSVIIVETPETTEMDCIAPPGVMEQEQLFLGVLHNVTTFRIFGHQLWLETADGRALIFTPSTPANALGLPTIQAIKP